MTRVRIYRFFTVFFVGVLLPSILLFPQLVYAAPSEKDLKTLYNETTFYDPDPASCEVEPEQTVEAPTEPIDSNAQQLAKQMLENSNIAYWTNNGVNTRDIVVAISEGKRAYTTASNAGNKEANINPNILRFILEVAEDHKIHVNALTDKTHSNGSNHYKGLAVDLDASTGNTAPLSILDPIAKKYGGKKNHETTHHHYDFLDREAPSTPRPEIDAVSPATSACSCSELPTGNTANGPSGNMNMWRGKEVWTKEELGLIEKNKPAYIRAAKEVGIPWQVIPPIHHRESRLNSSSNPDNGQGVYQFYEKRGQYTPGPISEAEFLSQTKELASQLKNGYIKRNHSGNQSPVNADSIGDNVVKDMYFSYNGRNSGYKRQAQALGFDPEKEGYEGSPYVMNLVDDKRDPKTARSGTWGQVKRDNGPIEYPANSDWGAWPMYAALAGSSGSECAGGAGTANVNADGYAFPIAAKRKSDYSTFGALSPLPGHYHHGGNPNGTSPAYDLGVKGYGSDGSEGAPVYAIYDAKIVKVRKKRNGGPCDDLTLQAKDSFTYWYGHLAENNSIKAGQDVKAGQEIGKVGTRVCADGTTPHLHISRVPAGAPADSMSHRDRSLIPLMNKLFKELPD